MGWKNLSGLQLLGIQEPGVSGVSTQEHPDDRLLAPYSGRTRATLFQVLSESTLWLIVLCPGGNYFPSPAWYCTILKSGHYPNLLCVEVSQFFVAKLMLKYWSNNKVIRTLTDCHLVGSSANKNNNKNKPKV